MSLITLRLTRHLRFGKPVTRTGLGRNMVPRTGAAGEPAVRAAAGCGRGPALPGVLGGRVRVRPAITRGTGVHDPRRQAHVPGQQARRRGAGLGGARPSAHGRVQGAHQE